MVRFLSLALLVGGLALVGCTGSGEDGTPAPIDAQAGSVALVHVERTADPVDPSLVGPRTVLGAVFARYRGLDGRQVLGLLGEDRAAAPLDTCSVPEGGAVSLANPSAEVDLVDVGTLDVQVDDQHAALAARTFPELGSLVAGAFYAEDADLPVARADVDEYRIHAGGGGQVPPFDLVAVGPSGPTSLRIDGQSPDDGPVLNRNEALSLDWDAGDPRDRLEIDLISGGHVVECVARDDGSFRIDGVLLGRLEPDDGARLVVRRVRLSRVDVTGIDAAWVSLAATRTVPITVR